MPLSPENQAIMDRERANAKALSDADDRAVLWKALALFLAAYLIFILLDSHGCFGPYQGWAPGVEP